MMARAQYHITASKFGLVIKRHRNHRSLAQLLYPSHWARLGGQQHQSDALKACKMTLNSNHTVNEVEFCVSDCGYLGASPDGVVKDSNKDPICLIEVKCPFKEIC